MRKSVVCCLLHGIGSYKTEDFTDDVATSIGKPFDRDLKERVKDRLAGQFESVYWQPIWWSNGPIFSRQDVLFDERKPPRLWRWAFNGAINALSDASAFQLPPSYPQDLEAYRKSAYYEVVSTIRGALRKIERTVGGELPVIVIADSMGAHVVSSYIWDAGQRELRLTDEDGEPPTPFEKLETLRSVIFTGCNIPLLTMGVPRERKIPLRVPRAGGGTWENFYDVDDPLGYPIAKEYESYFGVPDAPAFSGTVPNDRNPDEEVRPLDEKIKTNGLGGMTPFAHLRYWRHRKVVAAVARALVQASP